MAEAKASMLNKRDIVTLDDARKKDHIARYSASPEYEKTKAEEQLNNAKKFVNRLAEIIELDER